MEISKWNAACYLQSSTGLMLMALSLASPWYHIGAEKFYIFQIESSETTSEQIVQAMNIAHICLSLGIFFGWIFLVTSFLRSGRASAAIGWLSTGLLAVEIVYVLSRAIGSTSGFGLEPGWFTGYLALVLIGTAATFELNKAFLQAKQDVQTGPFQD